MIKKLEKWVEECNQEIMQRLGSYEYVRETLVESLNVIARENDIDLSIDQDDNLLVLKMTLDDDSSGSLVKAYSYIVTQCVVTQGVVMEKRFKIKNIIADRMEIKF